MKVGIEITNEALFQASVEQVELASLKAESKEVFTGLIRIHSKARGIIPFYGFIETYDFEKQFGFMLMPMEENILTGVPKTV